MKPVRTKWFVPLSAVAILVTVVACAAPQPQVVEKVVTQVVEKEKVVEATAVVEVEKQVEVAQTQVIEETVTLTVAVPEYMFAAPEYETPDQLLIDALANATKKLEENESLQPGSIKTEVFQIKGCLGCRCRPVPPDTLIGYPPEGDPISLGDVDLFLAPSNIVAVFGNWYGDNIELSEVPKDQSDASTKALAGFTDPGGRLLAVPQGTKPVMLIYNRALLKPYGYDFDAGDLTNVSWSEMIEIAGKLEGATDVERSAVILADSSIALAEIESTTKGLLKSKFDIYEFLKGGFLELGGKALVDGTVDKFFQYDTVVSSTAYPDVHKAFADGKVAFVFDTSDFLTGLREQGYQDAVGVGYLPSYGDPAANRGTSAMMLGWMAPDSGNSDRAIQLATILSQEPNMVELGLKHGYLPTASAAWSTLDQAKWSDLLSVDEGAVEKLKELAAESTAWQIPKEFSSPEYVPVLDAILGLAAQNIVSMADTKSFGPSGAAKELQELFKSYKLP